MKITKFTKKLLIATLIGVVAGFFITILTPIKYKVVSEFEFSDLEPEDAVVLAKKTIYDVGFINSVQDAFPTSYDFFSQDDDGLKRDWKNVVKISYNLKTKHIETVVLHDNLENTIKLSRAMTSQFQSKVSDVKIIRNSEADDRIASPDVRKIIPISVITAIVMFLAVEWLVNNQKKQERRSGQSAKNDDYNARTKNWLNDKH